MEWGRKGNLRREVKGGRKEKGRGRGRGRINMEGVEEAKNEQ